MFFADELNLNNENEINELKDFLLKFKVIFKMPDRSYIVRNNGQIIATGSSEKNILKYFFVDCTYSGQGAITAIFNRLLEDMLRDGYKSYFMFTTPNNQAIFQSLGLKEVGTTDKVTLLEGGFYDFDEWIKDTKKELGPKKGKRGAMVANCNPMTLGHKFLISEALNYVDELLVFIVEEDLSVFPFEARYSIVKNELKEFENVKVLKGGPYIISKGTFPTYFLKKKDSLLDVYTELDATIFGQKIAKELDISTRFIGTEEGDPVTNAYNRSLIKILDDYNVGLELISRLKIGDIIVSASHVRKLIKEGKVERAIKFLTPSTKEFLKTDEGKKILDKIKNENMIN